MSTVLVSRRLDIVDDSPFLQEAVAHIVGRSVPSLQVAVRADTWIDYLRAIVEPSPLVLLRADMRDHVPAAIKVRALTKVGSLSIVTMHHGSDSFVDRLVAEGAFHVVSGQQRLTHLVSVLREAAVADLPAAIRAVHDADFLSDREAQIACLFASRAAPSASVVARLLGISPDTARAHLAHARQRLADPRASTRAGLREVLSERGWLHEDV